MRGMDHAREGFVILALAPAMTLPEGSFTVPTTAPWLCANVEAHSATITTITARQILKVESIRILADSFIFTNRLSSLRDLGRVSRVTQENQIVLYGKTSDWRTNDFMSLIQIVLSDHGRGYEELISGNNRLGSYAKQNEFLDDKRLDERGSSVLKLRRLKRPRSLIP